MSSSAAHGSTRCGCLKQKKIATDYLVPCDVRPADDPTLTEVSLAENITRKAMHPADEFDAFKKLDDEGRGAGDDRGAVRRHAHHGPPTPEARRRQPETDRRVPPGRVALAQPMAFTLIP